MKTILLVAGLLASVALLAGCASPEESNRGGGATDSTATNCVGGAGTTGGTDAGAGSTGTTNGNGGTSTAGGTDTTAGTGGSLDDCEEDMTGTGTTTETTTTTDTTTTTGGASG